MFAMLKALFTRSSYFPFEVEWLNVRSGGSSHSWFDTKEEALEFFHMGFEVYGTNGEWYVGRVLDNNKQIITLAEFNAAF